MITLGDYKMSSEYLDMLEDIRECRKNLLVVGSTTAGKTTWLRAYLKDILERECPRIISIEDTPELNLGSDSCVALHSTNDVSQLRLVKTAMRLRPDRLVLGEIRDEAARAMIQAFGTGHPGACTVHGGTLLDGLVRVQQLSGMPVDMISGAIHYAILIERDRVTGERRPTDFARVSSLDNHFFLQSIEKAVA